MPIERVGEERDVTTNSSSVLPSNEKYRLEELEKERLEAIGRTVVQLFSLLNHAAPPPLTGVVVIQEKAPVQEELPPPVSETVPEQTEAAQSQDNVETVNMVPGASEEIAQNQISPVSPEAEFVSQEMSPPVKETAESEKVAEPLPLTPEQIHQMIQLYVEQIRFYADVAAREKKLLASEEKIRFLQQLNSQQLASALNKKPDAKMQREQVIAQYEKDIEEAQRKIIELELLMQKRL